MVATTDLLIEDIDFRRDSIPPLLLGHKALAVSLSDIAAMGARPRWAMVSLAVPRQVWENDFVDRFYDGVFALADLYDVRVVGGDTSRTEQTITINSTLIGECETGSAVTRAGAQVGDQIFVTGSLGGSGAGLRLLERGARLDQNGNAEADGPMIRQLLMRHACPQPRIGWGVVLGEERLATAMIDVSDGLSSDLNQLCNESKVGARVDSAALPVDPLLTELCGRRALDPLLLALNGGEDFELLFTVRPGDVERLPTRVDGITVTRIGEITPESDRIQISEKDRVWELEPGGFDHFRTNR